MANMSYCRFQNTWRDLADCERHIGDNLKSESENDARMKLLDLCAAILVKWGTTGEVNEDFTVEHLEPNEYDDEEMEDNFSGEYEGYED